MSTATYTQWWQEIVNAGNDATLMVEHHKQLIDTDERRALAEQARLAARKFELLAETLVLL